MAKKKAKKTAPKKMTKAQIFTHISEETGFSKKDAIAIHPIIINQEFIINILVRNWKYRMS